MYQNIRKMEDLVIFTHEDLLTIFWKTIVTGMCTHILNLGVNCNNHLFKFCVFFLYKLFDMY